MINNNPSSFSVGGSVGGNVNNIQGNKIYAVQGDNNQVVIGDSNEVTQKTQGNIEEVENLTKTDILQLFAKLAILLQLAELPEDTKAELIEDLSAAKTATNREEPNKERALNRLTTIAETLEKTSKSIDAGHKIWQASKPVLTKIAVWLGAAAGSHFLGL